MKVLFTYDYKDEAFEKVRALGYEVDYWPENEMASYENKASVDILICYNPFPHMDLKDFKKLKNIFLSSIGFDQLPLKDVEAMDIVVCNNKGGYSIPMGEWIVMKLLELTKHTKDMYSRQEKQIWHMDTNVEEVYEKRVLFFGTGTIATEAAKRLQGFDMTVVGLNTSGNQMKYFDLCYNIDMSIEEVKKADAIVIALPLTSSTRGYFDQNHISVMKPSAVLINIARGEIVDEVALIEALKSKKIKGGALDVFHEEPLPKHHPMWQLENVSISCHNSWISEKRNSRRFDTIYKNLKRKVNNVSLINVLDIKKGY